MVTAITKGLDAYAERPSPAAPGARLTAHGERGLALVVTVLGVLALSNFAHFYCIFFAGLCELSNVPLAVLEVFKLVPDMKALHPQLVVRARHAFSLLFIPLRLIYWPLVSHSFWRASLAALGSGAEFNAVILFYLLANGSLTALQFAWGAQLIRGYLFRSRREKEA